MPLRRVLPTAALALAVLVAGCGAKTDEKVQVKTGPGVTDDKISLGILTDMTGPFKASALTRMKGYDLYVKQVNDRGGICGRKIELKQKDHAYDVQKALDAYFDLEPQVLGLLELAGTPMTAAIEPDIMQTRTLTAPASWAASLLGNPHMMIVGTTYDLDVINGLDHYKRRGVIKEGDTVGHVYVQGSYGDNAVEGSRFVGTQWNMKIAEQPIGETTADLAQQIGALKAAGAKAVVLSTTPAQTAAAVGVAAALKWEVPFMVNVVGFDTAILDSPVGPAVEKQVSVVTSVAPFTGTQAGPREVAAAFNKYYPNDKPHDLRRPRLHRREGVPLGHREGVPERRPLARRRAGRVPQHQRPGHPGPDQRAALLARRAAVGHAVLHHQGRLEGARRSHHRRGAVRVRSREDEGHPSQVAAK